MGKIELDHTGSGGGITLSSDGTDLLLDGTAIGGGGGAALELYAENPSSPTAPSATGANAVAIGSASLASNSNAIAAGFSAAAQGADSIAIGRGATSSNFSGATALGLSAAAYGTQAVALGKSRASGTDSFAAAITNNTSSYGATGLNSVAIGNLAKATSTSNVALGYSLTTSATYAVAIGSVNTSSATYATTIGSGNTASDFGSVAIGRLNTSSENDSVAMGFRAKSDIIGKSAFASGYFGAVGDAQTGKFVLRSDTTDATAEALTTNNSTAGTTNQIVVPTNAAYAFHGTIVAKQSGSANAAAWKVEGLIVNNGGTTTLTNSATTVLSNTPSWGMALSADNTNNALAITVTGAAATNIRWVATIHTSEVTYA